MKGRAPGARARLSSPRARREDAPIADPDLSPAPGPGAPFDLPGGPDAALFLHGLTGSPFEVRALAEALGPLGLRRVGPVLDGHGGGAAGLAGTRWQDWLDSALEALLRLDGARRTYVVGCSMGALLALALAHDHPARVDGLVLLAPALHLAPLPALAGLLARHTRLGDLLPPLPKGASDVRDPDMRARNPSMKAVPIAAVGELQALAARVDRMLPGVVAPALVVAGGRDHTVRRSGARRIAGRIGSAPARLLVLRDSWHLVGIDVERDLLADEVAAFLSRLAPPVSPE